MIKKLIFFLIIVFVGLFLIMTVQKNSAQTLSVNGKTFGYDIAATREERQQGLSGRESLEPNRVLLFEFENPDKYGIWMKDMNFSIDIIWLDKDKKVVDVKKDVSPDTYPTVFYPNNKALYVVESNSGVAESLNLQDGDKFAF